MSFDTNQKTKLDIAFKKLLNKSTLNINDVANSEPIGTNVSISTSTIFAEAITSAPGVTPTSSGSNYASDATVEHIRFIATAHPDSDVGGKYHAYTLRLPDTYETRSTQPSKATLPFGNGKVLYESLGKLQLVPPSFGGSYAAKPYRAGTENVIGSGTEIPPLATEAWVIDYYSGVLYLENPTNDLITFVDAYLYIGDMADQNSAASLEHESVIVLDANRSDTYTEDGSSERPYKTFASAWTALNTAEDTVFYFNPGTYTMNLTDAGAMAKKLSFIGQSKDSVILTPADIAVDCFKLTDKTGGLFFSNLTIQEAKYGIRVVNGTEVTLDTVRFSKCGSDGAVANHDGSKNQADQATAWNSNQLTNGGACRIENCTGAVTIKNCSVDYSLRGCRVQNCTGGGFIVNNEMLRTLESAVYLASSSYDGLNGSIGFEIVNNNIAEAANNAILVIGGKDNVIKDNVIRKAWNSPIMLWHTLNTVIDSNRVIGSNVILHNGIGNLGDSWAQVSAAGATNIAQTGGSFVFQSTNNVFTDCGQGRLSQAYKVAINPNYHIDNTSVMDYPTSYSPLLQYSSDNDYSDLADEVYAQSTNITRKNLVTNFNQQVADLGDINLSSVSDGDIIKYNSGTWANTPLNYADINGRPSLATVATSGSFADLQSTPTASTLTAGIVELATLQETAQGTDATRAVTPAGLAAELSGVGTADRVFEGQARVEAFDDGSAGGAVIKFSVDPSNAGSPFDVWHIDGSGHIIPQVNEAYDLGKSDKKVRHLFLSDNSIKMGDNNKEISLSEAGRLRYDGNDVTTDNLLSDVATSGSYGDLSNKPTVPSASTDLADGASLAKLDSPALTGTPTAPTAGPGTNTTQIATTQFVRTEVAGIVGGVTYKGTINVADFATTLVNAEQGDFYKIATGGTASDNRAYATNDSILINANMGGTYSDAKVDKIDNTEAVTLVNGSTGAITLSANDLAADHTASNYTATNANIDGHLSGIDTALSSLGAQDLNGLSDVTITGANPGEVIRYNGSAWVDAQLAYSDLSGNLPAVDGSALTGITASQVGALSTLSSSAMNDLGDVTYTPGAGIDGYKLAYNNSTSKWEAVSDQDDAYIVQTSSITLSADSKYIIPVSVSSTLTFEIPLQVDAGVIEVVNLSDQTIVVKGATGRLFTADGQQAPSFGGYTRILYESKGTIKLVRDKGSSVNGEWYAHFHYPIETVSDGLLDGDALVYETISRSFKPSGVNAGEFVLTGNVSPGAVTARHKYVTAYNETNPRTVEIGNPYYHTDNCNALHNRRLYFENRGSSTLTIDIDQGPFVSGVNYRTYFYNFDGTGQSGSQKVLNAKESAVIEVVYDSTASAPTLKLFYQQNGHQLSIASTQVTGLATVATSGAYSDLTGAPSLATVATSGNYSDLSGKPTLGSASSASTGTSAGNVVVLDSNARLPAVDASQLTNLPSGGNTSRYIHVANVTTTTHTTNVTAAMFADHDILHRWTSQSSGSASINLPSLSTLSIGDKIEYSFGAEDWNLTFKGVDSNSVIYSSKGGQVYSTSGLTIKSGTSAINVAVVADQMGKCFYLSEVVPATLDLLANVSISSIQGGQTLAYNATSGKWENTTLGTASTAASTDFLSGTGADTLGGDLDVGTSDIISSSNNAIDLAPHGTGVVTIRGNSTGGSGQLKLNCENNSHGVTIKGPPHSASATYTLTLPNDDGNANQVLKTDGSGALSWVDQPSATPQLDAGQSANVNSDNVATGMKISSTPASGSSVQIFVNGVGAHLAGSTGGGDCFFSDGSGGARALNAITATDELYWNGSSSYSLDTTDRIEIRYNA